MFLLILVINNMWINGEELDDHYRFDLIRCKWGKQNDERNLSQTNKYYCLSLKIFSSSYKHANLQKKAGENDQKAT